MPERRFHGAEIIGQLLSINFPLRVELARCARKGLTPSVAIFSADRCGDWRWESRLASSRVRDLEADHANAALDFCPMLDTGLVQHKLETFDSICSGADCS